MKSKILIGVEYLDTGEREVFFEKGAAQVEEKILELYGPRAHKFFDPSLDFKALKNGKHKAPSV